MSITAEIAPSQVETANPKAIVTDGRGPLLAIIVIVVSVLATLAWGAAMVWLARTMFGTL